MLSPEELKIQKENQDLKTLRSRSMKLKLTDEQVSRLKEIANEIDIPYTQILENFIGDLVNYHRNGSDEMHMAQDWYERAIASKRRY